MSEKHDPVEARRTSTRQTNAALRHSAATPWLVDLLAGVAMAGVVVFNAAQFNIYVRILFLLLLLLALFLETQYSADAQARSDRFLMLTLGGIIGGLIVAIIATIIVLSLFHQDWVVWVLFAALIVASFLVARGFRYISVKLVERNLDEMRKLRESQE